jgi:hypothetical protein
MNGSNKNVSLYVLILDYISQTKSIVNTLYEVICASASALLDRDTHPSIQLSDGSYNNRGMSLHRYLDSARTMNHRMYLPTILSD